MQHTLRRPPSACANTSVSAHARPQALATSSATKLHLSPVRVFCNGTTTCNGRRSDSRLCAVLDAPRSAADSFPAEPAPSPGFASIPEAVADLRAGKFVVVLDDADRENEGDLIMVAEHASQQALAFLVEHSSGYVCIGMTGEALDRLQLPLQVNTAENNESMYTAMAVTVDVREGTTTGISASDRARTLRALAAPDAQPQGFRRPGHIVPLRYQEGGVLRRRGHTEAAVDLAWLAGCAPAGVLCEIIDRRDGEMARGQYLADFAAEFGLKSITIEDLAQYLEAHPELQLPSAGARQ